MLAAVCWCVFGYVFRPARTDGWSMDPTIRDGSFHLLNLWTFRFREPRRGDIVAIQKSSRSTYYLKRILAVPRDRVAFSAGRLILNGEEVLEPYVTLTGDWEMREQVLGHEEYFVAGDNRSVPREQHVAGITKREHLRGSLIW